MSKETNKLKLSLKLEISASIANICKAYLSADNVSIYDIKQVLEEDELKLSKLAFLTNYKEEDLEDTEIEEMGEADPEEDL